MLALSIRQPYAELILRGVKTIEYSSRATRMIGKRFYIYVPRKWAGVNGYAVPPSRAGKGSGVGSNPSDHVAPSVVDELTRPLTPALEGGGNRLPTGVIVGTAVISHCTPGCTGGTPGSPFAYEWHLKDVKRFAKPRALTPGCRPQPVWFRAF